MRTSGVLICFSANFLMAFIALGARFLKPLRREEERRRGGWKEGGEEGGGGKGRRSEVNYDTITVAHFM